MKKNVVKAYINKKINCIQKYETLKFIIAKLKKHHSENIKNR